MTILFEGDSDARITVYQEEKLTTEAARAPRRDIRLNPRSGMRINLIRVIYTLCKLDFFVDSLGEKVPACKVFEAVGELLQMDLTNYRVDMNSSLQEGKSEEKHLSIFRKMLAVMRRRYEES